MNIHARHWVILKLRRGVVEATIGSTCLTIVAIESALLRADNNDLITNGDACVPLTAPLIDELRLV